IQDAPAPGRLCARFRVAVSICVWHASQALCRVLAALRAARLRSARPRRWAARCAWRESARCEAARRGWRFKAFRVARARLGEARWDLLLAAGLPRLFGSGTPARRAFDRPMA